MVLTLESLLILDAIERAGSFAAAARALDKVPSALSYTVRRLEQDLDVLLFDRRGHRARLTAAGSELLNEGRHLLQAATELERRVRHTASGWEVQLHIVLDSSIPFARLQPILADFDRDVSGTELHFSQEVLTGVWESLWSGRADLAIGAAHEYPDALGLSGNFQTRVLGTLDWVFAVAPGHPLAQAPAPLSAATIQQHRAIVVGDTGRALPAMTAGLLSGQARLTVPTMQDKLAAQIAGLGCGHLPAALAAPYLRSGALVARQTEAARPTTQARLAWRSAARGKCMKWFLNRLAQADVEGMLLG